MNPRTRTPFDRQMTTAIACLLFLFRLSVSNGQKLESNVDRITPQRLVNVSDTIEMTKLGDPSYNAGGPSEGHVAQISADKSKFVVVVRRGNLASNTNEYSILLWRVIELHHAHPAVLLTMSSSSNRPAIEQISWLADNETIAFLGEEPGELHQLYFFNIRNRKLKKITTHPSNLIAYTLTPDGKCVAYTAEEAFHSFFDDAARRTGLVVSDQKLSQLVADKKGGSLWGDIQLFVQTNTSTRREVVVEGKLPWLSGVPFSLSPDGKYIAIDTFVREIPDDWNQYTDPGIHHAASQHLKPGWYSTLLQRLVLIDTETKKSRPLIDAPLGTSGTNVMWSKDSHSIVIDNTFLPLGPTIGDEQTLRKSSTFAIQVKVPSGQFLKISHEALKLVEWDANANVRTFQPAAFSGGGGSASIVFFHGTGSTWERLRQIPSDSDPLQVILDENMNTPPRLYAVDEKTGVKTLLVDLNSQFNRLRIGRVKEIHWKGTDGKEANGGLYFPPAYMTGVKYPLVIQTHGFRRDRFWIDGPWTTAYAAQPLASKGIMVLQASEDYSDLDTPGEGEREVAKLEGAVEYLDEAGLVDRKRVGVIGFSRTGLFVCYALTHSKFKFAAASVTDGDTGGYFSYIADSNYWINFNQFYEGVNGGPPFGDGLGMWLARSPGFNLDKVETPTANKTAILPSPSNTPVGVKCEVVLV